MRNTRSCNFSFTDGTVARLDAVVNLMKADARLVKLLCTEQPKPPREAPVVDDVGLTAEDYAAVRSAALMPHSTLVGKLLLSKVLLSQATGGACMRIVRAAQIRNAQNKKRAEHARTMTVNISRVAEALLLMGLERMDAAVESAGRQGLDAGEAGQKRIDCRPRQEA